MHDTEITRLSRTHVCQSGWLCSLQCYICWSVSMQSARMQCPTPGMQQNCSAEVAAPPIPATTHAVADVEHSLCTHSFERPRERKEKFTLLSNHNGSLLRRQPGAMTIGHSPKGKTVPPPLLKDPEQSRMSLPCQTHTSSGVATLLWTHQNVHN